jgi:hypothetical protein
MKNDDDILNTRIHFDTGSSRTLFSYEELKELGQIPKFVVWTPDDLNEIEYSYYDHEVEIGFVRANGKGEKIKKVRLRVILDWLACPFVAPCSSTCNALKRDVISDKDGNSYAFNCVNRKGLFGRNILSDLNFKVILDGDLYSSEIETK